MRRGHPSTRELRCLLRISISRTSRIFVKAKSSGGSAKTVTQTESSIGTASLVKVYATTRLTSTLIGLIMEGAIRVVVLDISFTELINQTRKN